jgi:cobalamin biosynthesis protein CobD/CbiB
VLTTAERHGTVGPAATDLLDQAGDVTRAVAEGHSEQARKRLADLVRKTEKLVQKGQIRPAAIDGVRQAVAQFSRAVQRSS